MYLEVITEYRTGKTSGYVTLSPRGLSYANRCTICSSNQKQTDRIESRHIDKGKKKVQEREQGSWISSTKSSASENPHTCIH